MSISAVLGPPKQTTAFHPNSTPTILQPVDEALREANKYFKHTLNLTRRSTAESLTDSLLRPTSSEINELKNGVERFGAYLHAKATAELEEVMRLQDEVCDKYTLAHDLYEQLKLGSELQCEDSSSGPWDAEWKKSEHMPYTLCYILTRKHDVPQPKGRTQQQWEDVFLTNTKGHTHARATEASWKAAIKDAEGEAKNACMLLRESSRLLRDAARTETVDRHSMLREVSNRWCDVFSEHITVQDVFEFHRGTLVATRSAYDAEEVATQGHSPFDPVTQYDLILTKSIPDVLQKLDKALKIWASEEMAPKGKKIVSLATDFDFKLQKIQRTYHDMQLDLKEARQFLRDHIAAVAAADPAALPNAFAPMLPHTPTALRC